jgi:hypothetical protein
MAVDVIVDVDVIVSAPVIVAALVNRNDNVGVIDAVSDDAAGGWERRIDTELYARGIELLECIVAMLT